MNYNNEENRPEQPDLRSKLNNIGISLMLKQGYESTTIRQICREAGVAIGTFYIYFTSKSDLLEILYEVSDNYFSPMLSMDFGNRSASSLFEEFIETYIKLDVDSGLDKLKLLTNIHNKFSLQKRAPYKALLRIVEYGQERGEFRDDYDIDDMLDFVFDVLHGITKRYCISDGAFDIASRIRLSSMMVLDAIRKRD
ncbi:MAG: TetR/AcrR family transcriptional regulator [Hungateiclostridium thermocellum]|nr:TetR/AcrR family transcriptional regulator [Acetivibrio thermocellus]